MQLFNKRSGDPAVFSQKFNPQFVLIISEMLKVGNAEMISLLISWGLPPSLFLIPQSFSVSAFSDFSVCPR
jgi:hypothetical protein